MKEQKQNILKKYPIFRLIRNYLYIILGVVYFIVYFNSFFKEILNTFFGKIIYGKIIFNYLTGFIAFFTILGIIGILIFIFSKIFNKIIIKSKNKLQKIFFEEIINFFEMTKYIIGIYITTYFLEIQDTTSIYINKIFISLILLIFIYIFANTFSTFVEKILTKTFKIKFLNKSLLNFSKKIVIVTIWIIGIIVILSNLGFNVTALVTGAGIGGLAMAFAAQKSISNIFGAITILLNKPFIIGDYVTVNGINGTVKDLGLTYITLTQKDGHQVMVPNESIISTNVENFSVRESRRAEFSIGLIYDTSLEDMKKGVKIIEDILETYLKNETISSYRANFDMFGNFSLNISATYFSLLNDSYKDFLKQKEEINLKIKDEFKKSGLEMAFPTQELIIKNEKVV